MLHLSLTQQSDADMHQAWVQVIAGIAGCLCCMHLHVDDGVSWSLGVPLMTEQRCCTQVVAFIKGTRTQPQCGFSHRVLTLLNESRLPYEVVNVLDDVYNPGLRDEIKAFSQWPTIPQVWDLAPTSRKEESLAPAPCSRLRMRRDRALVLPPHHV